MSGAEALQARLRRAESLERSGELGLAEAAYREVLDRCPALPDTWYNLARLQRRAGRPEAALESYGQALTHCVERPEEVHLNRGVIYADDLRQPARAEAELEQALQINPHYVPALLNLGNLQSDLGRRDDARCSYERVLAVDPRCWSALARHAELSSIEGPGDPVVTRLERALADDGAGDADRATLGFALGRALDACGDYARAFSTYGMANRASRAARPAGIAGYDRGRHEAFIDELIGTFTPGWFRRRVGIDRRTHLHLRHVPLRLDTRRTGARGASTGHVGGGSTPCCAWFARS